MKSLYREWKDCNYTGTSLLQGQRFKGKTYCAFSPDRAPNKMRPKAIKKIIRYEARYLSPDEVLLSLGITKPKPGQEVPHYPVIEKVELKEPKHINLLLGI